MPEYIEREVLYKQISEMEELARNRYLDTPHNSPCYSRYMAQLDERERFKHMVCDAASADVVSRAAYDQVLWERDTALKQLRDDYGVGLGEKKDDVATVRHGRWVMKHRHRGGFHRYTGIDDMGEQHTITVDERVEYDDRYCSECGKQSADNFLNYCPNCGAKMDGEEHNG